eukprot:TRINITY_DN43680_c1_g1_i1.p1 TRINITY_DN43680_c1_g1~~TRINITY_DN43680_c1_g1_i1.p1  ORF type:complete len:213 (+),score=30.45 TRINITY_DN43680_c1_g1_i1:507-1145(+)
MRVPLVATRLRGRAAAWWQQFKLSWTRLGKSKIATWEKMKKYMHSMFLPYNFQRTLYQRLQNLRQGTRTVEDYTTQFYQLVARNEIQELEDQLVARYIGGLRVQIQDTVNLFDPVSVSAAHQRALQVEKQLMRRSNSGVAGNPGSSNSGGVHRSSSRINPGQQASSNPTQTNKTINSGIKCFGCSETGHRRSECKKRGKKALFADTDDGEEG